MFEVIGYKKVNFTPKDSVNEIRGVNLYVSYSDTNVTGCATDRIFVKEDIAASYFPKIGDKIRVDYNRYGKVSAVELI